MGKRASGKGMGAGESKEKWPCYERWPCISGNFFLSDLFVLLISLLGGGGESAREARGKKALPLAAGLTVLVRLVVSSGTEEQGRAGEQGEEGLASGHTLVAFESVPNQAKRDARSHSHVARPTCTLESVMASVRCYLQHPCRPYQRWRLCGLTPSSSPEAAFSTSCFLTCHHCPRYITWWSVLREGPQFLYSKRSVVSKRCLGGPTRITVSRGLNRRHLLANRLKRKKAVDKRKFSSFLRIETRTI